MMGDTEQPIWAAARYHLAENNMPQFSVIFLYVISHATSLKYWLRPLHFYLARFRALLYNGYVIITTCNDALPIWYLAFDGRFYMEDNRALADGFRLMPMTIDSLPLRRDGFLGFISLRRIYAVLPRQYI